MTNHLRETMQSFQKWSNSMSTTLAVLLNRFAGHRNKLVALLLAPLAFATQSPGASFYWLAGSDVWQSTTAWSGAPAFPGSGDNALFTNAATYSVTLNADVLNIQSNFFSNTSNTTAVVTLNLGSYELNPAYGGTSPGAFNVADGSTCTTTVYLASSGVSGKGLVVPGRVVIGRNGIGTLIVTNGSVSASTTLLANGSNGRGTLVLSGPSVVWTNSTDCAVGNSSNSFGSALVVSNSATMVVVGTLRVGSGSSSGGSSNNTLLLDTGARLYTHTGPVTIGNNGSTTSTASSYNNNATVQGGAIWDNGNSTLVIGYNAGVGVATGNVLTVGIGGTITNVSHGTITAGNALNMAGGAFSGPIDVCPGVVQGFGTMYNNVSISGYLTPSNSFGTLAFSNQLALASTATTSFQLGTNCNPVVVRGILTLAGTLNFTDGGGFTNGAYTLFTYNSTLAYNSPTIGTTPGGSWIYTISTNTPHAVQLVVSPPPTPPVANFTGNPTAGGAPLVVTFTDSSTGTIANRLWSFGDGATLSTALTSFGHTYSATGTFDVSLTVFGPLGTNTLTMPGYITATNVPLPSITNGVSVANAPLQVGNTILVVAGDTNEFSVGATDTGGNTLTYQWSFGDGTVGDFSPSNTVEHIYTNDCGPYVASVTVSNGLGAITTNFDVTVACQLDLSKVQPKLNFAKTNSDSCAASGSFALPSDTVFTGKVATVDIGGGSLTFTFPLKKGSAVNGLSKLSMPTFNKKTGLWSLKVTFKNGFWQIPWADYSMVNSNIAKPGITVTNLPVILLLDNEGFMGTVNLTYTATQGKSGSAK
ncbi:MAG TPA: PKD domain-containing protein [Verrucomicrobiae bacterium]|nr:PKD domain-containing protein [Verrucomicrobiae bacterium]